MSTTLKAAILALKSRIADAYTAISNKGGTLPAQQTAANLPTAIESIPSGDPNPYGDLTWWTGSAFGQDYTVQNRLSPNDYSVSSPYLEKSADDLIIIRYSYYMGGYMGHNYITPSFNQKESKNSLLIDVFDSNYVKKDYWKYSHVSAGGHNLGGYTIFRVYSTIYLARYMQIVNATTNEVYWQGDRYENYSIDNDLSKANLIKCINAELGQNCYMYLSPTKYAELAMDADVVAALTNKPNVTLVEAS